MSRIIALSLLLTVPLVAVADDARDETKKLEGVWKVASAEMDGNPFDAKKFGMNS